MAIAGAGGVLAELRPDVAVSLAPVDLTEAFAMIKEVRSLAPLTGFRFPRAGDLEALAKAVVSLSNLAGVLEVL